MIKPANLTPERQEWISDIFESWNDSKGYSKKHENFCFEYTENEECLGIIHGRFFAGWCGITSIAVAPNARGKGVGLQLMKRVEKEACKRDSEGIYLATISFQAPEFYEKLGFNCYAELPSYAGQENKKMLYKKVLNK